MSVKSNESKGRPVFIGTYNHEPFAAIWPATVHEAAVAARALGYVTWA
jgi:hypothetical protein